MNIDNFRSVVNDLGVLPPNRFKVEIPQFAQDELMMCADVTLPAETIQSFEYAMPGIGPVTKVPNRILFEGFLMQFYVLGDNRPYSTFREWKSMIYDENYRFNDMPSYTRDIFVREFNRQGLAVGTHIYRKCYPSVIAPKTKNTAPSNTPELFSVTMNYETSEFQP